MSFYTIDPYYSTQFYNECKEALRNNGVEFQEYINIKAPYDWYFEIDKEPVFVNYDKASDSVKRWMVSKVIPLRANEKYLLLRRDNDNGVKALAKFVENKALKEARKAPYAVFFHAKNREFLEQLTKEYPLKIWYFGKYYNNKFKVCLATHELIKGLLDKSQILLERGDYTKPGRFESEFNYRVLRERDRLIKFSEMPYFLKGQYKQPKIRGDYTSRFLI